MQERAAQFSVGQIIRHEKFEYRGVIFDVDAEYTGSEEWYQLVARSRPPRDRPWYHVLVDGAEHTTYVAERHLASDPSRAPIRHPLLEEVFDHFDAGRYSRGGSLS